MRNFANIKSAKICVSRISPTNSDVGSEADSSADSKVGSNSDFNLNSEENRDVREKVFCVVNYAYSNGIAIHASDVLNLVKNKEITLIKDVCDFVDFIALIQHFSNLEYMLGFLGFRFMAKAEVEFSFNEGEFIEVSMADSRCVNLNVCSGVFSAIGQTMTRGMNAVRVGGSRRNYKNPLIRKSDLPVIKEILSGKENAEKNGYRKSKAVADYCNLVVAPTKFTDMTPEVQYSEVYSLMVQNNLPPEVIDQLCPAIRRYIAKGEISPILMIGEGGIGKTMTAQIISNILGIPFKQISATNMATSMGFAGTAAHYTCADVGELTRLMLDNGQCNVSMLIDEIDKCQAGGSGVNLENELLSVCDGSRCIMDKFMGIEVNLSKTLIFLTANDESAISPYLRDRCVKVYFPKPTLDRLETIVLRKFFNMATDDVINEHLDYDEDVLTRGIQKLWDKGIRSFRPYLNYIDALYHVVEKTYFETGNDVVVSDQMVDGIVDKVRSSYGNTIGFSS